MADFNIYSATVSELEGGYQNLKNDRGNYNSKGELVGTNHGIAAPTYENWLGYPPSENDMRKITKSIAAEIFKSWYWNPLRATEINSQAIAETLVDHAINAGPKTAVILMQRTLNELGERLDDDGKVGKLTLNAINNIPEQDLFNSYSNARLEYYQKLNNSFWLPIWSKRVFDFANKFGLEIKKKEI